MKFIKWVFLILSLLVTLSLVGISPIIWIGILLILFGVYQKIQQNKGKVTFSKPGRLIAIGFAFSWIMAFIFVEPATESAEKEKVDEIQSLVSVDDDKEKEMKKQQAELERQKELEKQAELERQRELEKQAELERQKELEKQAELERQKELEKQAEQKRQEPVVEQEYFSNCKEMNAVYPNGVPEDHPAYASARDRDKDGWACER